MEDFRTDLGAQMMFSFPTGSSVICDPPVLDTDRDVAVLVRSLDASALLLIKHGWEVSVDDPTYRIDLNGEIKFLTARKGPGVTTNLIMFEEEEGYRAFESATAVAKHLNLTNKEDRILLFQAVCSGRNREFWDIQEFEA